VRSVCLLVETNFYIIFPSMPMSSKWSLSLWFSDQICVLLARPSHPPWLVHTSNIPLPRRYPYFDRVVELAWSYDPESYAGGSVAAGRVSHGGKVKSDDPNKKGYPGAAGWGWAWGWRPHPVKSFNCWENLTIAAGRKESNRKGDQVSSWTVAPEEEEEVLVI
jgi:hypothetical protein